MRILPFIATFAALVLPCAAQAADCKLQIADSIPLLHLGSQRFVPITINGTQEYFLFDTGGYVSQVSRATVEALKLPTRQGNFQLFDATGNISRQQASIHDLTFGRRHGADFTWPVSPIDGFDGILALDQLIKLDVDIDFGSDKLNFFFPDHCPGQVVYWTAPTSVAVIPITMQSFHITVPVTIDGHEERAVIDTGAGRTSFSMDEEKRNFSLNLGDADTPQNGFLNGDTSLKVYKHRFQSLKFGDVAVNNPEVDIIPNAVGRNADRAQYVGDRTKSDRTEFKIPDMIIGMDVLQKLHIYIAFGENKMYISPVPPQTPAMIAQATAALPQGLLQQAYKKYAANRLRNLGERIGSNPDNVAMLNDRCWILATIRSELDNALADCQKAVKLAPGDTHILDSNALVLYQQGKYQDALNLYDAVLKADPRAAPSLLMRGYTKGKLGDQAGREADVAAAKEIQPNIEMEFKPFDISS